MFEYQEKKHFFAQVAGGMEELGAEELAELQARDIRPAYRGAYFEADSAALYRINYSSRLLTRVLAPLVSFKCMDTDQLYRKSKLLRWDVIFSPENTFAIFANVSNSTIRHSRFAALRLKDAIADFFQERFRRRPGVNTDQPDVWINLHIENDRAAISLDTSGGSLHRRGYRKKSLEAPMQETLAAAIIRFSGWEGAQPLYDPMCGAGTLLCEALMYYCRIPAGYLRRRFGFEFLPDFDPALWESVKQQADQQIRELPLEKLNGRPPLAGSDKSYPAIAAAKTNMRNLLYGERVKLTVSDFRKISGLESAVIICNPPYGIRSGKKENMAAFYKAFGDFLKQRCRGAVAYVYFGDRELIPHIGLRPSWKKPLVNGALDGRLARFEMY
jgi:putative N6-adenine-specific DNA methylase